MSDESEKTLNEIEQTQVELRECIEVVNNLAEQSDNLIKRHRKEMKKQR